MSQKQARQPGKNQFNFRKSVGSNNRNFGRQYQEPVPQSLIEVGHVHGNCENDLVLKSDIRDRVPYFNASIYLENKQPIGKVDEILGPIKSYFFSVKLEKIMKATNFEIDQILYINPMKLLPLQRFTNPQSSSAPKGVTKANQQSRPGMKNRSPWAKLVQDRKDSNKATNQHRNSGKFSKQRGKPNYNR
ncbi:MAG: H/ACA snoRNP pseudouridylase subunit [Marteilia pararefringens]